MIPKAGGGVPPQKTISPLWSVCSSNSVRRLDTLGEQHLRRIPPAAANWLDENGSAPFEAANGTYAAYRLLPRLKLDEAVVDADLSKYFDMIPHDDLMRSIALRIVDRAVLSLLKSWLQAPVQGDGPQGPKSMSGGKQNKLGTPQGGVISPMLANRYMNRYLRYWRQCEGEKKFSAKLHYLSCIPAIEVNLLYGWVPKPESNRPGWEISSVNYKLQNVLEERLRQRPSFFTKHETTILTA